MKLNVAVVNMPTIFADVEENMKQAEVYIRNASEQLSKLIIFPEFFTTGFALNQELIPAILNSDYVEENLKQLSSKYNIGIGGSYLKKDDDKKEIYNIYGLFFPNGECFYHRKDIPTGLENFCYTGGDDISAFDTPLGRIGIAICWEQLRYQTVKRMAGKIDLLVGGSCWWGFVREDGKITYDSLYDINRILAQTAPVNMAKILGVPFVHASHSSKFPGLSILPPQKQCVRDIESNTMIIAADGSILLKEHNRAGCYYQTINSGCINSNVTTPKDKYWIPDMPEFMIKGFDSLNKKYHEYYIQKIKPQIWKETASRGIE